MLSGYQVKGESGGSLGGGWQKVAMKLSGVVAVPSTHNLWLP